MTHAIPTRYLVQLTDSQRLPLVAVLAVRFACVVTTWDARARSRRALARLDDNALADVGLTREQARTEAARMFWRI